MKNKSQPKKEHARAAFAEFAAALFNLPLGKLSNKQLTEGLTRFYLDEVYSPLHSPVSEEDFDIGFVDAGGDLGADFIHRDDQTVLILQTKYLAEDKAVTLQDIQHFQTVFNRIVVPAFKPNAKLAEALAEIDLDHDQFVLKFITLGRIVGQAQQQTEADLIFPVATLAERVDFQYLDGSQLTDELRNARSLAAGIPGDCELVATGKRGQRSPIIDLDEAEYHSCVLVVDASQLVRLYQQYRDSLFTLNIRNYLGSTATNKLLLATLRGEASRFYYYNNGIACLAEEFAITDDRVKVKGLQIINGAQTVRSLAKAARGAGGVAHLRDAQVLVRITCAATQYAQEGRFRDQIVRYNNTQNIIKASDFRSNDAIHADLKKRFGEYRWRGKKVVYVPKRTDPTVHRTEAPVPVEEFAKVIYSFLADPTSFSSRTSFLFDDGEAGGYRTIFGDGLEVWPTMPDAEFRLRSAIWWLASAFTERLKTDKRASSDSLIKAALERKWMLLFAARLVLERSYDGSGYRAELQKLYKGDWEFGKEAPGSWVAQIYNSAKSCLIYKYKDAAGQPGFVHRNWMRDPKTVEALRTFIMNAPIQLVRREKR